MSLDQVLDRETCTEVITATVARKSWQDDDFDVDDDDDDDDDDDYNDDDDDNDVNDDIDDDNDNENSGERCEPQQHCRDGGEGGLSSSS